MGWRSILSREHSHRYDRAGNSPYIARRYTLARPSNRKQSWCCNKP
jgi:hypothetical protein